MQGMKLVNRSSVRRLATYHTGECVCQIENILKEAQFFSYIKFQQGAYSISKVRSLWSKYLLFVGN
jgi:hypothetical protein